MQKTRHQVLQTLLIFWEDQREAFLKIQYHWYTRQRKRSVFGLWKLNYRHSVSSQLQSGISRQKKKKAVFLIWSFKNGPKCSHHLHYNQLWVLMQTQMNNAWVLTSDFFVSWWLLLCAVSLIPSTDTNAGLNEVLAHISVCPKLWKYARALIQNFMPFGKFQSRSLLSEVLCELFDCFGGLSQKNVGIYYYYYCIVFHFILKRFL